MEKRIVTTTAVFPPGIGFEALDMALDYECEKGSPFLGDKSLEWAAALRKQSEQVGVPYTHAHAPGDAGVESVIGRSLEAAAALGAGFMVLHPIWKDAEGSIIGDEEVFIRRNAEAIRPWLGKARDCGVVILTENLLWGASLDPRIISRLVEAVDSPWFGWCFDTGHANFFGYRPEILTECAAVPLSLHLQDNHGIGSSDEHLIPGDGTVDWDAMVKTLRKVGYAGDCVMEAHHQSLDAPDEERDAILARLLIEARKLRDALCGKSVTKE